MAQPARQAGRQSTSTGAIGRQAGVDGAMRKRSLADELLEVLCSPNFDPTGKSDRENRVLHYVDISKNHFVYVNMRYLMKGFKVVTKYHRAGDKAWFFVSGKKFSKEMNDPQAKWKYRGADKTDDVRVYTDENAEPHELEFLDEDELWDLN